MFVRYYIIPAEPETIRGETVQLHADALGQCAAVVSEDRSHFIVKVQRARTNQFDAVEALPNVIPATRDNLVRLAAAGVDADGLSGASAGDDVERRISTWIDGTDRPLRELIPLMPGEEVG